jgi:hypothetical protein
MKAAVQSLLFSSLSLSSSQSSLLSSLTNPFFPMLHLSCIIIIEIPIYSLPLLKDIFLVWITAAAAAAAA